MTAGRGDRLPRLHGSPNILDAVFKRGSRVSGRKRTVTREMPFNNLSEELGGYGMPK